MRLYRHVCAFVIYIYNNIQDASVTNVIGLYSASLFISFIRINKRGTV